VLSGGSTPRRLLRELAGAPAGEVPWARVHLFWGDERTVPPNHPDSNFRMVEDELLSRVAVPAANLHRFRGEDRDPAAAAAGYEAELRGFFDLGPEQLPRFDLVFLGMGGDGHTASLFPGAAALTQPDRLVVAPWVDRLTTRRLTLTLRVFNAAACVVFLVTGGEKAATLQRVLEGPRGRLELPSQLVVPVDGDLVWLVDTAAARLLSPRSFQHAPPTIGESP
jgi:6-phosphogluconolactonase